MDSDESVKSVNSENALHSCVETVIVHPKVGVVTTFFVALVKLKESETVQATGCRFSEIFGLGNDFCEPIRIAWV